MSTILKALRRLEDEKQAGAGRPLREEVVAALPGEPLPGRRRRALWLGLGACAALAAAAAWVLLGPGRALEREAPDRARAVAPAAPGAVTPKPVVSAAPPAAALEPEPVAPAPAAALDAGPAASPEPAPAPSPRAAPAPPVPPPAAAPAPRPAPVRAAAPAPPPVAAAPPVELDPSPAEVVAPSLPRIRVAGTVWHPDPGRRTARVALEGRDAPLELRQGDAVGSLVVREIEPSGVVFQLGAVELRRGVGEAP
jgi:hypothetical protein